MSTATKTVSASDIRSASAMRAWAVKRGINVGERGRISEEIRTKYEKAHRRREAK